MRKRLLAVFAAIGVFLMSGQEAMSANPKVRLVTSKGPIVIELYADKAPETVKNFLGYVTAKHYDGTIFHRVIAGFMIQGGGFDIDFNQKPTRSSIRNEANNGLKNLTGTVAMARTSDPHSASAQFFINTVDNAFLDHRDQSQRGWGYAVFAKVIEGMDVAKSIEAVRTGNVGQFGDVPTTPVVIERAEVLP